MTARWLVLFGFAISQSVNAGSVQVDLFENIPPGSEFELAGRHPVERYTENAFGFVRVPTKYSPNALALDLSTPYILRAAFERDLAAGERQFRLRARGAAVFMVDGAVVAKTKPQPPNTSGDDPVPPPIVREDSPLRPAPYPHQDVVVKLKLDAGMHSFVLVAIVGGRGLSPTPGELVVSLGAPGELERLLGTDGSPHLVDAEWEAYVASTQAVHARADIARR